LEKFISVSHFFGQSGGQSDKVLAFYSRHQSFSRTANGNTQRDLQALVAVADEAS
jgi:hypothetical protein